MEDKFITVKEYATRKGVTIQAVSKQKKTHAKELEGHIIVREGKQWLDKEAVRIMDEASNNSAPVIVETENKQKVDQLEDELRAANEQIENLMQKYVKTLEENKKLALGLSEQSKAIGLLEAKEDENKALKSNLSDAENRFQQAWDGMGRVIEENTNLKREHNQERHDYEKRVIELQNKLDAEKEISNQSKLLQEEVEHLKNRSLLERLLNK